MKEVNVLYALSILLVIFISGFILNYLRRYRNIEGARTFMWLSAMVGLLAILEGLSIVAPSAAWALFWFELRFVGLASIPVIWLIFIIRYTGNGRLLNRFRTALLFIVPAVTQVMIWTNGFHGLWVKKQVSFYPEGPFYIAQTAARVPGPWMWMHLAYSYTLVIIGLFILASASMRLYRRDTSQVVVIGAGALIMAVAALLPGLGLIAESWFNPLIPGLAAGMIVVFWGIHRHRFLRVKPDFREADRTPSALITLFACLTLGIMAAGYYYYWHYERGYRAEIERLLSSVGELKVGELVQWRNERLADAAVLYENGLFIQLMERVIRRPDDRDARKQMEIWLGNIRKAYQYKNVLVLDASGHLIQSVKGPHQAVCEEIEKHILRVSQSPGPVFLDFHRETPGGAITLSVLTPIFNGHRFVGIVALVIDPDTYLYPMIQRWPTPSKTAETLLVRREGNDVVFLNDLKFKKNTAVQLRFPLFQKDLPAARAAQGEEGVIEGIDYRGEKVVASIRTVPGSPWFMVARMDKEEIYAPLWERLWIMLLLVFSLIGGAGITVLLLWQRQRTRFQTEKITAAEALLASEERFKQVFEAANVGKSVTQPTGEVSVNKTFCEMLGYTKEELVGKHWQDLTPQDEIEMVEKAIAPLRTGEKSSTRLTKRFIRKDGSHLSADVSVAAHYDKEGVLQYFITTVIDITDRIKAEEDIAQLNADLDRRVDERTSELRAKTDELERINKIFVDRELRMRELKKRISELEKQ